ADACVERRIYWRDDVWSAAPGADSSLGSGAPRSGWFGGGRVRADGDLWSRQTFSRRDLGLAWRSSLHIARRRADIRWIVCRRSIRLSPRGNFSGQLSRGAMRLECFARPENGILSLVAVCYDCPDRCAEHGKRDRRAGYDLVDCVDFVVGSDSGRYRTTVRRLSPVAIAWRYTGIGSGNWRKCVFDACAAVSF